MSVDFANINASFFDLLEDYNQLTEQDSFDPEDRVKRLLNLVQKAKEDIANKNSASAFFWYGEHLIEGYEGFPIQVDEGIKYVNEAAMMRSTDALSCLGDVYSGLCVNVPEDRIDFDKAIRNYTKAFDSGSGYAGYRLACIYGGDPETHKDVRKALDCLERSAEVHQDENSLYLMSRWHYFGEHLQQDFNKAYEFSKKVIDNSKTGKPETPRQAQATFIMGIMTAVSYTHLTLPTTPYV